MGCMKQPTGSPPSPLRLLLPLLAALLLAAPAAATWSVVAVDTYAADHIILPPDMRAFEEEEENFVAYKVATAHGAGRIEFGTYDLRVDELDEVRSGLERRYGSAA